MTHSALVSSEPVSETSERYAEPDRVPHRPRIAGVATATPPNSYTQLELLDLFQVSDARIRSIFLNSAIGRRYLTLPEVNADGTLRDETQAELLQKHLTCGTDLAARAVRSCLARAALDVASIGYLCCVTSSGFLTPGLSAHLVKELGLSPYTGRLDVVGMGCNAGLNGLTAATGWAAANPGQLAVLVCVEVCSAAYVIDSTMRSTVVNSLFGDGAAAVAIMADGRLRGGPVAGGARLGGPTILRFASFMIPDSIAAMRYDWDEEHGKFSFFLDRDVPYVVGAHAEPIIDHLLVGAGLRRRDISHWVVHSGGKKVIDSVRVNLGLTRHDVRHTTGVLEEYGNVSSCSFLFSLERLVDEGALRPGDYGVFMAMGPGSTIETCLFRC